MEHPIAANKTCAVSLKLLGDYWTLRIIDSLEPGPLRFCELQRALDNLNPATLSGRLKKLEHSQLVNKREDTGDKCAVVYFLSPLGREALPVLDAFDHFAGKAAGTLANTSVA